MEEIVIKSLVARQHKNTPFDYRKYRNTLAIDKIEIENDWVEYYVTRKCVGTISNRRKGIAIVHCGNVFYLIDRDDNEILSTTNKLIRVFGGYYVSLGEHRFNYRTFPGQDRDTEYETTTIIYDIYDENGERINSKQDAGFFKSMDILQTMTAVEIGEDRVFYKNALYDLSDYSLVASFTKNIRLEGMFIDGQCKVRCPEDDRNFIVAVLGHKVWQVFDEDEFRRIVEVLNLDVEKEECNYGVSEIIEQNEIEDMDCVVEYYPKAEITIEKYLASSPTVIVHDLLTYRLEPMFTDEYIDRFNAPGMLNYVMSVMACKYYKSSSYSHYLHIPYEGYKLLYESISSVNNKRPNFIKKVVEVGSCNILSEQCDLYRFECRPYGYITPSGKLIYDFDVNSIKW